MMFRNTSVLFGLLICLAIAPSMVASEAALEPVSQEVAPNPEGAVVSEPGAASPVVTRQLPRSFEEFLAEATRGPEAAGCSAWYPCVHGGSVSCSAPTGTCTSSGQRCGRVTCNGQTTWCPGACQHAFNCATFCYQNYGSSDGDCDSFGCCICY